MADENLKQILVVDEPGADRDLLCKQLRGHNFQVIKSDDNLEVVPLLKQNDIRVLIVGSKVQEDVLHLIKQLRRSHNQAELPIIVISALSSTENRVAAWKAGANYYIAKPVKEDELVAKVNLCFRLNSDYSLIKSSEERLILAMQAVNGGIFDWDLQTKTMFSSPKIYELLDISNESQEADSSQNWLDRLHEEDRRSINSEIENYLKGKIHKLDKQCRLLRPDGTCRWVSLYGVVCRDKNGKAIRLVGSLNDIGSSISYDNVTGLPGSHMFYDLLEKAMVRAIRSEQYLFGLLSIDIDPQSTDKLTEPNYEKILTDISRRLQLSSRASDFLSRIGENRFAVLLDGLHDISDALRVARRISEALAVPFEMPEGDLNVSTSIGIAVSNDNYDSPEELLEDAHQASLSARASGSRRACMANPKLQEQAEQRLKREKELYDAIAGQQFVARYMPIVDVTTNSVVGVETLLRWRHPDGKLLEPEEFLKLCDNDRFILPIGSQLIKLALGQLADVNQAASLPEQFSVSFNLEARQFYDPDLLNNILLSCEDYGFASERIRLEITEDVLNNDFAKASAIIGKCAEHGIKIVIDKFGSTSLPIADLITLNPAALKTDYKLLTSQTLSLEQKLRYSQLCKQIADFLHCQCWVNGATSEELSQSLSENGLKLQEGYVFGQPVNRHALESLAEAGYLLKKN
ncbi:MAG: EAL domain-containing protein [bacterium]|nr:EAL domain-containing protein [bacterium]